MFIYSKKHHSLKRWPKAWLSILCVIGLANDLSAYFFWQTTPETTRTAAKTAYDKALDYRTDLKFKQADTYFLKAQQLYEEDQGWNMSVGCAIYRCQINYELEQLDSLEQIIQRAQLTLDQQALKEEHFKQERILFFQAMLYESTGRYQMAEEILDRATEILEGIKPHAPIDSAYMSSHKTLSGSISYDRRDYQTAINRYQAALSILPTSRPDQDKLLSIYNNLGLAYIEQEQEVEKGMDYLGKSLVILSELDRRTNYNDYLQTYFNLVKGYLSLRNTRKAVFYLDQAVPLLQYKADDWHFWYSLKAQVQELQGHWALALSNYQAALQARQEVRGHHHPSVAKLYQSIGQVALKLSRDSLALSAVQNGLQVFDKNFDQSEVFNTPSMEGVSDYYLFLQLLKDKGDLLLAHYPEQASNTLPTFRLAIQAIDSLRLLYESEASKLLLSKEAKPVFSSAIVLLHQLHQEQPNPSYLEEAFQYMEKSKALLLLENIRKWRNIRLENSQKKGVDQNFIFLLEKEKKAKLDIVLLQRTIDDVRESIADNASEDLPPLTEALSKVTVSYEAIKTDLSDQFPQYYEASYGDKVTTIFNIQEKLLNNQTALISYFIADQEAYAMLIQKDGVHFQALPSLDQWQDDFQVYQNALRSQGSALLNANTFKTYTRSASNLYRHLMGPLVDNLSPKHEQLYLVPDDILGFLAFESLLTASPNTDTVDYRPTNLNYLNAQFALAYGYSATLLVESLDRKNKKEKAEDYVGFAPVFEDGSHGKALSRDCTTGSLLYLPYSKESVEKTSELFGGASFIHGNASLENFRLVADQYKILQLSTHACIDQNDALFNVIYFADTTLATYEIFDIPIQADLVILSACETGHGDLLQGEGIMSLSRGFYYAGSSNIVTSLWPADDYATKELMIKFNAYLKKGYSKDKALRKAKLDYLNTPDLSRERYAPALWANFILIGNQDQIELGLFNWSKDWWVLLFCMGLLSLAGYYFFIQRQK